MIFLLLILLLLVLLAVALYVDARAGIHFTFLDETDMAFVIRGQELYKVLIGLKRSDSEKVREKIEEREIKWSDRESSILAKCLGIYYVSIFYPLFKIHKFSILAEGIKDGSEGKEIIPGDNMEKLIYRRQKEVNSLRWRFPRPVIVNGVELADKVTINIIVMTILEIEDPYPPVFTYRGYFFQIVASFVESAVIDLVVGKPKNITYAEFVGMDKGEASDFSSSLCDAINAGNKANGKGLPTIMGIKADKAYIFRYDLSAEQKEVEEASRAESVEKMRAQGVVAKAEGNAKAIEINALSEALRFKAIIESMVKQEVNPNMAAEVARTIIKTENVRDSKVTTWVDAEGGLKNIFGGQK